MINRAEAPEKPASIDPSLHVEPHPPTSEVKVNLLLKKEVP